MIAEYLDSEEIQLVESYCSGPLKQDGLNYEENTTFLERPLDKWREDETHPQLYCKCPIPKPMQCKRWGPQKENVRFLCMMDHMAKEWQRAKKNHEKSQEKLDASKKKPFDIPEVTTCGYVLWESDAKAKLERIDRHIDRAPVMQSMYDPLEVCLRQHVSRPLKNHVPPLANIETWQYKTPFFALNADTKASVKEIMRWSDYADEDLPLPKSFEGHPPSKAAIKGIVALVEMLIKVGFKCLSPRVLPDVDLQADSDAVEELFNESLPELESTPNGFVVRQVTFRNQRSCRYDYTFQFHSMSLRVKIVETWPCGGIERFPLELHGFGPHEIGWLYASHADWLLFTSPTDGIVPKLFWRNKVAPMMRKLAPTLPLVARKHMPRNQPTKGLIPLSILATKLNVWTSDQEHHDATPRTSMCGPSCAPADCRAETSTPSAHVPWSWLPPSSKDDITMVSVSGGTASDQFMLIPPNTDALTNASVDLSRFAFVNQQM